MRFSRMISLSQTEAQFIQHLDTFSRSLTPPVDCRIAGGWVRDKLLSLPSHDVDIALSIPSGHSFAVQFVEYLKTQGITSGSVGKVAANPEQSKHLETGTTKILGLECDFVGLRSETYTDTRIPEVRPGTPLEDASRRDLTINALFYNVHSRQVEDYTEKGLSDLQNKIARTPLPPFETFNDDPLRILRCIRFAARYDLTIEQNVQEAIKDASIKAALGSKVSKERVGIEVMKMLQKTPALAMDWIHRMELLESVFTCSVNPPRDEVRPHCEILHHMEGTHPFHWLAAATTPFDGIQVPVPGKTGKEIPAVAEVIQSGLKLGNDVKDGVTKLFEAAKIIDPTATQRSHIGTMLQNPSVRPWERSMVWAIVSAIRPKWQGQWDDNAQSTFNVYKEFIQRIHDLGLPEAIERPPVLDGKAVQGLLNIKPSPVLSSILRAINVWQLDNPEGTKEECEVWLKAKWEAGDWAEEVAALAAAKGGKGEKGAKGDKGVKGDKGDKGEKRKR